MEATALLPHGLHEEAAGSRCNEVVVDEVQHDFLTRCHVRAFFLRKRVASWLLVSSCGFPEQGQLSEDGAEQTGQHVNLLLATITAEHFLLRDSQVEEVFSHELGHK